MYIEENHVRSIVHLASHHGQFWVAGPLLHNITYRRIYYITHRSSICDYRLWELTPRSPIRTPLTARFHTRSRARGDYSLITNILYSY
jgi:hypothetical protein